MGLQITCKYNLIITNIKTRKKTEKQKHADKMCFFSSLKYLSESNKEENNTIRLERCRSICLSWQPVLLTWDAEAAGEK